MSIEGDAEQGRVDAEKDRVEAEKGRDTAERAAEGRVDAENHRVEAEGSEVAGRRAAEAGRVESEDERVEAENEREVAAEKREAMLLRWLPLIVGATVIMLLLAIAQTIRVQGAISDANEAVRTANESKADQAALEKESRIRRDQNCKSFEGDHIRDHRATIKELERWRQTKKLIARIEKPPKTPLDQAIVNNYPMVLDDLRIAWVTSAGDPAPEYCDAKGVGLKEPDPEPIPWPKGAGPQPKQIPGRIDATP